MANLNNKYSRIAIISVVAALYAVITVFLPVPQYQAVQFRAAEALYVLPLLLGWPGAWGVTLGCLIANLFSPYGLLDMTLGTFSSLVGSVIAVYLGKITTKKNLKWTLSATFVLASLETALIIGVLLQYYGVPFIAGATGVLAGELVSMFVLGYPLGMALHRVWPEMFILPEGE